MSRGILGARITFRCFRYSALAVVLTFAGVFLVSCSEASEDKPSGEKKSQSSEPKLTKEPTKDSVAESTSRPETTGEPTSKNEETTVQDEKALEEETTEEILEETTEPERALEVVSADAAPDAAFDGLLPDLRAITADTIMLPAVLPEDLGNPAIWGVRPTEEAMIYPEYGIVFADMTLDDTFAEPPRAAMRGTLASAPVPAGMPENVPKGFEESNVEEVELPDGTVATLRYLTPIGTTNTPSQWEGRFEKDGSGYFLEIYGDESDSDNARQILMSMVKVPNEVSPGETEETVTEETEKSSEDPATFIEDYYQAVSDEDWSKTYSYLTIAAQDQFTEEEWATAQSLRVAQNPKPPIASVETVDATAGGDAAILDVLITYEDGSEDVFSGVTVVADTVNEPYGIKRDLSESDVAYLRGLLEGT